jgi:3-hydroxyacyl-CoA dehydrogenase/enoyl-CoA hydratase/3-hydroxybutyryl-CoA epimerase
MGIGFPAHTGGVFQFVNAYGLEAFVQRADELAERYGERFAAPAIVREKAAKGELFL